MTAGPAADVRFAARGGSPGDALAARLRSAVGATESDAEVDVVLALDAAALAAARVAGVKVRVAITRGLAASFEGGLDDATHVALPHAAATARAGGREALVVGLACAEDPGALAGAAMTAEARENARRAAGLAADARVVVVDALELRDVGLRSVLIQLALAEPPPVVLFDVGEDVALADALRAELPGHTLDAFLFAGAERAVQLPLADLALGRASGPLVERAIVSALPVLPLPREDSADDVALAVLLACGGAPPPRALAVLSVALDVALSGPAGASPTAIAAELDAPGMPSRLAVAASDALRADRAGRGPRAVGLPVGLERIGSRDDTTRPAPDATDLDSRIDAELAALKKRL